jgi:hypothetical protein
MELINMTIKLVHNCETGEIQEITMSTKELETIAKSHSDYEANKAAALVARQAVLDKLGLTADEAALLLS